MPCVRQRITAGMAQHMRMHLQPDVCSRAQALDHASKASRGERRAALRHEHEGRGRVFLALQLAQLQSADGLTRWVSINGIVRLAAEGIISFPEHLRGEVIPLRTHYSGIPPLRRPSINFSIGPGV